MPESNLLLKVCPRCEMAHSKYDTHCERCAKMAKIIQTKLPDIRERWSAGGELDEHEQQLLDHVTNFLERHGLNEKDFLSQAPFDLPDQLIEARPSFQNRLLYFADRMQEEGRQVTTTQAAVKTFKEYVKNKPMDKRIFVDFATDHGVRPLMSADWNQFFSAWDQNDILNLLDEWVAEGSAQTTIETKPEALKSSVEAGAALGITGQAFVELATVNGIKPVQSFGTRPEQLVWRVEDIEALHKVHKLESVINALETAKTTLERVITDLQKPPMKWPQMEAFRLRKKELEDVNVKLEKAWQAFEQEQAKLQNLANQPEKTASRLVRILLLT